MTRTQGLSVIAAVVLLVSPDAFAQSPAELAAIEGRVEDAVREMNAPFTHAMRSAEETPEDARMKINAWIRFNYQKAFAYKAQDNAEDALFHYLLARHALRDATLPAANDAGGNPALFGRTLEHRPAAKHDWRDKVDRDTRAMFDMNYVPKGDLLRMYGIDSPAGPVDRPNQLPRPDLGGAR